MPDSHAPQPIHVPDEWLLAAAVEAHNDGRETLADFDGDDLAYLADGIAAVIPLVRAAQAAEIERLRAELERRIDADAEALADKTMMRGLTVKDGAVNLDLIPPREIAAIWVHCAVGMLGDAPNYTETEVKMPSASMEISPAGSVERYALIVQRVGKLTPHEARQQAEREREEWRDRAERAEVALGRARDLCARSPLCVPGEGRR